MDKSTNTCPGIVFSFKKKEKTFKTIVSSSDTENFQ